MTATSVKKFNNLRKSPLIRKVRPITLLPYLQGKRAIENMASYELRPPIIANSLPKSGTHLLLQMLNSIEDTNNFGRFIATTPSLTLREKSPQKLATKIHSLVPGELVGAHMYYDKQLLAAANEVNALSFFIYRDPRDVIVSEIEYLTNMNRWHRMHKHYRNAKSKEQRIKLALFGYDEKYPDATSRLMPYVGWLAERDVTKVRYEDLVGPERDIELTRILTTHSQKTGEKVNLQAAKSALDPQKSHTFRRGGSGNWKTYVPSELQDIFTTEINKALVAFGYASKPAEKEE